MSTDNKNNEHQDLKVDAKVADSQNEADSKFEQRKILDTNPIQIDELADSAAPGPANSGSPWRKRWEPP